MNDTIQVELKILVERVVRPVRASTSRKRMMREELLAHVTAMHEDEARPGDENAALERTCRRFGDPAELTDQLQRSLSLPCRFVWLAEIVLFPSTESSWRRAVRHANLLAGGMLALWLLIVILTAAIANVVTPWREWRDFGAALFAFWLTFVVGSMIFQRVLHAIHGPAERFWPSVVELAGVVGAATPLAMMAFAFVATWDWKTCTAEVAWMVPSLAILPAAGLIFLAKTARHVFHGPVDLPYQRIMLSDLGWFVVVLGVVCGLTFAVTGEAWPSLPGMLATYSGPLPFLILFDSVLANSAKLAEIRADLERQLAAARGDQEWANLRIN